MKTCTIRHTTFGSGLPKIAIPLTAADPEELRAQLSLLRAQPYDLIEWRGDYFSPLTQEETAGAALSAAARLIRSAIGEAPLLFTIRTAKEGGALDCTFEAYRRLCLLAAGESEIDLVDVQMEGARAGEVPAREVCTLVRALQEKGKRVIGSYHDFEKTPDAAAITGRLEQMQQMGMDITKMAVMPRSGADVITLLDASVQMKEHRADRPFITMSMGPAGQISRVAGCLTGSAVTFGTAGAASAPGQLPADALSQILRALAQTG